MTRPSFYEDRRYCPRCGRYVPYMRALEVAYCALCDHRVRLFSEEDQRAFQRTILVPSAFRRDPEADERLLEVLAARHEESRRSLRRRRHAG